jgi:glutamate synthase domain-containing protein 1
MFKLEIDTTSDAFAGQDYPYEIARILRAVADAVFQSSQANGTIRDINGNRVGTWLATKPE